MAAYLLREFPEGGDQFTLAASKGVLASRLNLTPEHFSRILADLCSQQLITFKGRQISLLDRAGLRRCAE